MNINKKKKRSLAARLAIWGLPTLAVALVAGFIGFRLWFTSYLQSSGFRQLIGGITAKQLKATGEYMPFSFAGTAVYSDAFKAKGTAQSSFSELEANQIRAELNLGGLWKHAWQIDEIGIQRLQVSLGHAGTEPAESAVDITPESATENSMPSWKWLPNHVDLRKVRVQEANLKWGENTPQPGSVENMALTITPDGDAWNILCEGGTVSQKGGPDLMIDTAQLRYQRPSLYITDAQLKYGSTGSIGVSGEVNFEKDFDMLVKLNGIPVTPFLREDWRAKFKGNLVGEVKIHAPLPLQGTPETEGTINLTDGQLEALPVLDQIATFTSTQRFRILSLTKATAHFTQSNGRTTVTNFIAESQGLIRVEGGFITENGNIDGTFQVGITPSSLQWLPAALQSSIFSVAHDGYVWTPVHVTGPVDHPSEDLTPRLVAAAGGAIIDTVKGVIQQLPGGNSIPDAPKQIINDLLSPLLNK